MPGASDTAMVRVWDPLIRIGHWVLVASFATAYLSEGEPQWLHTWAGYVIAGWVVLRILLGFVGSRHARFSDFLTGPGRVIAYLRDLVMGRSERHIGHSPAGGAMTVALILALSLTALTGMATLAVEEGQGPLAGIVTEQTLPAWAIEGGEYERGDGGDHGAREEGGEAFEELHEIASNGTVLLVLLHLAGVLWASRAHGENLVRAMFDGRKRAPE